MNDIRVRGREGEMERGRKGEGVCRNMLCFALHTMLENTDGHVRSGS